MPVTDVRRGRLAERAPTEVPPPRFPTVWAAALTAVLGLLFTGTTALTIALWSTDPAYTQTNPVVDLAFFALGGILITAGFASQIRSRQIAGVQQAILALLALALAGVLAGRIEPFIGALLLLVAAAPVVVLHPARRQLLAAGESVSRPLAALGAAAVVPAVAYAAVMLDRARSAGPSCFLGRCAEGDRFAEAAALAVAVVLVALLASLRTPGWTLSAWCAGSAAIVFGAACLVFPREPGALAAPWAVAAVVWGAACVVTVYRPHAGRAPRARAAENWQGR
ncbi:MAG TPA: hypothetical protein VFZ70_09210 [Euzebyales bacterium]